MTTLEFSNEFDILYNNITSNAAPGLSEYEKSVFLTQAQESTVVELYNGTFKGEGFEETEEVGRYLNILLKETEFVLSFDPLLSKWDRYLTYNVTLPEDLLFITREKASFGTDLMGGLDYMDVQPITQDEYQKTSQNPFRGSNNHRLLRILKGNNMISLAILQSVFEEKAKIKLIDPPLQYKYILSYIRKAKPIILQTLDNGLSINGETKVITSELDSTLHRYILVKAVTLAKAIWQN